MKTAFLAGLGVLALAACDVGAGDPASVPAGMQGRWGLVAADCEPGRDDAKGLMTVSATTLAFYESRAALGAIKTRGADRITADFAFSGEGQTWTRTIALQLTEGGTRLRREDAGSDPEALKVTYLRCP